MTHRQIVGFGWAAAILVVVLVLLQIQGGAWGMSDLRSGFR